MLQQILVHVGKAARRIWAVDHRLAIGADGRCEVGRGHQRQRLRPSRTWSPGDTSSRVTGPEIGASTLVAWSLSKSTTPVVSMRLVKARRRDGVEADDAAVAPRSASHCRPRRCWRSCRPCGEQLISGTSIAASRIAATEQRRPRDCAREIAVADLSILIVPTQVLAMPPAAAQRLKQGRGIGEAAGLGLHQRDARLLIGLFGVRRASVLA